MRNMLVPQVGQTPLVAGLPFFMVIALAFFISFLERHFTQYASIFFPHVFYFVLVYFKHGELFDITGSTIKPPAPETFSDTGLDSSTFIVGCFQPVSMGNNKFIYPQYEATSALITCY
jgi:hypothetical protein